MPKVKSKIITGPLCAGQVIRLAISHETAHESDYDMLGVFKVKKEFDPNAYLHENFYKLAEILLAAGLIEKFGEDITLLTFSDESGKLSVSTSTSKKELS